MRTIFIIFTILILFSCQNKVETKKMRMEIDSLTLKLKLNENNYDSIKIQNGNLKKEIDYWFDREYDGISFTNFGIENPKDFIISSLRKKTELIPLKAVLGGTMRFGNIELLSRKWLISDYNDGHIEGRAIYEYKLNNNGELEFQLIKSITPE